MVEKNFTFCVEKIGPKKLPVEKNDEYHVCIVYTHTQPMIWLPCDSCCFNDCKVRGKHILAISDSIAIFKYSSPAPPDNCRTINAFLPVRQDLTVSCKCALFDQPRKYCQPMGSLYWQVGISRSRLSANVWLGVTDIQKLAETNLCIARSALTAVSTYPVILCQTLHWSVHTADSCLLFASKR